MESDSGKKKQPLLIAAFTTEVVKTSVVRVFEQEEWNIELVEHPYFLSNRDSYGDLVVFDTGMDAALLTQIVYNIYNHCRGKEMPFIIPIASDKMSEWNPALHAWLIDGHAAVATILSHDNPEFEQSLRSMSRRLVF